VHAADHLVPGVPDRRLARFPQLFRNALADGLLDLPAFAPRFAELCAELEAAGIPETIQHDDLHGDNVFREGGALRILDWGDACVSHQLRRPFELAQRLAPPAHLFVLARVLAATGALEQSPDLASTLAETRESAR
jgi:hypothetical protein